MRCVVCKFGVTEPGTTTVTLERDQTVLVVRSVPAEVCNNCGEAYVDELTTKRLLDSAEAALHAGVQVDVREYKAA